MTHARGGQALDAALLHLAEEEQQRRRHGFGAAPGGNRLERADPAAGRRSEGGSIEEAMEMAGSGPEADFGGFRERRSFLQR